MAVRSKRVGKLDYFYVHELISNQLVKRHALCTTAK